MKRAARELGFLFQFSRREETEFEGRNGPGRCLGVGIKNAGYNRPLVLSMQPLTSRGNLSSGCRLEIPATHVELLAVEFAQLAAQLKLNGVKMAAPGELPAAPPEPLNGRREDLSL